jgi:mannose-6-phosphate isomerase
MAALIQITNTPRDYAWGAVDGVARALGRPRSAQPEAELWLGAHQLSPAQRVAAGGWRDLSEWETTTGQKLPYLLKVLCAAHPLSLQAHPTSDQAAAGFAREEADGIPVTAWERNYKDPCAKPELIVAVEDDFEALCGFRPVADTLDIIDALTRASSDPDPFDRWRGHVHDGVRDAFAWLQSGSPAVDRLVAAASDAAATDPRFELISRLAAEYPGDPGILVAAMLNHVTLAVGESLWLPAGNIHAYLWGTGVELMGPSDNVLRGGLTPKHVDRDELQAVLDFMPGPPSRLIPLQLSTNVLSYRPASTPSGKGVDFELLLVTGDACFATASPAIALTVSGSFIVSIESEDACVSELAHGDIVFVDASASLRVVGEGRMFVATGLGLTSMDVPA